jgi:anaerobic magnesium-protoporphyrin IX monomethyl ester cyclase
MNIVLISLFGLDFGVSYISSFLKEKGHSTYIIYFNKKIYRPEFSVNDYFTPQPLKYEACLEKDINLLITLLKELQPRLIAISVSSVTFQTACRITREVKKHFDIPVMWGGIHAIIAPEECIEYADIVCISEGEYPALELAEQIKRNQNISGIKNLWIKNKDGIEKNEMRNLIENIDELPFPDYIDRNNKFFIYGGRIDTDPPIDALSRILSYPIMTSRGCMYSKCSFCSNSIVKQRYNGRGIYFRRRSAENVVEELKHIVRNRDIDRVMFFDDVFAFDAEWIERFCALYIKNIAKPIWCYSHPRCADENILKRLAEVGLVFVQFGIQSGSEAISEGVFLRRQSNRDIIKFSHFARQLNVYRCYDVICDNPYETDDDHSVTVDLLLSLPPSFSVNFFSLCWFPETPLTKRALRDGVIDTKDLEQFTAKALNNFFMYLPLSPTKRDLFWNCIKVMAVNSLFPNFLVIKLKKSSFLRKYPQILYILAHIYVLLRTKFCFKLAHNRLMLMRKIPFRTPDGSMYYVDKDKIDYMYISGSHWLGREPWLQLKQKDCSVFPIESAGETKLFCLRLKKSIENTVFRIIIELMPFDSFKRKQKINKSWRWLAEFNTRNSDKTDVYFNLSFPDLTYSIDNHQYEAKMIKSPPQPNYIINKGTYSVELRRLHKYHKYNETLGILVLEL